MVNDIWRATNRYGETTMKKNELIRKIRRRLEKYSESRRTRESIAQLIVESDQLLELFKPVVVHGKEMTDEYNEYPSEKNRVVMELARQNVLHAAFGLAEMLTDKYNQLPHRAQEVFTFREFSHIVQDRITTILSTNNNQ